MKVSKLRSILSALPDDANIIFSETDTEVLFDITLFGQNNLPFLGEDVWLFKLIPLLCKTCEAPLGELNNPISIPPEKQDEFASAQYCEECIDK